MKRRFNAQEAVKSARHRCPSFFCSTCVHWWAAFQELSPLHRGAEPTGTSRGASLSLQCITPSPPRSECLHSLIRSARTRLRGRRGWPVKTKKYERNQPLSDSGRFAFEQTISHTYMRSDKTTLRPHSLRRSQDEMSSHRLDILRRSRRTVGPGRHPGRALQRRLCAGGARARSALGPALAVPSPDGRRRTRAQQLPIATPCDAVSLFSARRGNPSPSSCCWCCTLAVGASLSVSTEP